MHERIKKLRKALDLTQREFGERIGVKPNTIATYEIGRNEPIDAVISLICREFNVSEAWLRTGEGEMFVETPNDALDALAQEYHLDRFGRAVVEKMLNLSEKQWALFQDFATGVLESLSEDAVETGDTTKPATLTTLLTGNDIPIPTSPVGQEQAEPNFEAEARAEAELFYQQRLSEKRREKQVSFAKESDAG